MDFQTGQMVTYSEEDRSGTFHWHIGIYDHPSTKPGDHWIVAGAGLMLINEQRIAPIGTRGQLADQLTSAIHWMENAAKGLRYLNDREEILSQIKSAEILVERVQLILKALPAHEPQPGWEWFQDQ